MPLCRRQGRRKTKRIKLPFRLTPAECLRRHLCEQSSILLFRLGNKKDSRFDATGEKRENTIRRNKEDFFPAPAAASFYARIAAGLLFV